MATKHEIVSPTLTKFELGHIVAHCLTVMHKIDACVGNNPVNRFASYMNVFPRTLSLPHVATWDTVLVDHPLAAQDVASFQGAIRQFIAIHATDEDRHELLEYIRNSTKPRRMDVQTYDSRLRELNSHVNWLPGKDLPLTEDQLNQAFFDGMPTAWKESFQNASRSVRNIARADLIRFFRMQQKAAINSQKANQTKQLSKTRTRLSRNNNRNDLQVGKKSRPYKGAVKVDAKHQSFKSKEEGKKSGQIPDHAKCLIHPGSSHTWGKCYLNTNNKHQLQPKNGNGKKAKAKTTTRQVEVQIASMETEDVSIMSLLTSPEEGSTSTSNESTSCHQPAVNDDGTVATEVNGMLAQLCLDLKEHPEDAQALVAKFKAAQAVTTVIDANNGTFTFDAFTSDATHHLYDLSFHAMQESNTNVYDEIVGLYIQYSDEFYSNGIQATSDELSFDKVLHLRATSHAIVRIIQTLV
jgi:hypothetical protein